MRHLSVVSVLTTADSSQFALSLGKQSSGTKAEKCTAVYSNSNKGILSN